MSTEINIKKKIAILDEGGNVTTDATSVDFVGAGVTTTAVNGDVTVSILGGLTSAVTSVATAGLISGGTITSTGTISTSMSTNKLVGRYSALTGIMEEVTIGSGLTLTGAGTLNNTAIPTPLGYYGAFSDLTDQFATVVNTGYPILLGSTDLSNEVTIVSGSRITIANTGIYNIQWSGQFKNPTANIHDVTIWLRKNGVDVPGSSGKVAVTAKHGSFDGHVLPSWNYVIDPIAGDYYEFVWSTQDTSVHLSFDSAGNPPPSTASMIVTVTQQSGIMAGTGITALNSLTGSIQTLGTGSTGTDFAIVSSGTSHTFNIPTASALSRGLLSSTNWTTFNNKVDGSGTLNFLSKFTASGTIGNSLIQDNGTNLGISTAPVAGTKVTIQGSTGHGLRANTTGDGKYGLYGSAVNDGPGTFVGVYGEASDNGNRFVNTSYIGGKFFATNGVDQDGVYSLWLQDGTESIGKFLKSITADGKANWATMSVADTELAITTTGTSGAATLVGNTLNIPQYAAGGLSSVAFSPMPLSVCDTAPTAATTQYYYQTISEVTGTISKVKMWGFSGTDIVYFGIYRGRLGSTLTLIGQGAAACSIGPNEISLTAEIGQTLNLVVGENLVVGYYADGISWRTIYDVGISDALFGITNTANITTMPATPTGTATAIRFACTLYS